ncbi:MAG: hypothetical protein RLZZ350_653 [Verrucomicrobiota bacterium]
MNSKLKTQNSKLPFVSVNMAMTADGKIATANRAVSSFGSRRDHDHLLALRATADAVMCGAHTADLNEINLGPGAKKFRTARIKRGLAEFNLRILVTGSGTLDPRAEIFRHNFSPILILTTRRASAAKIKKLRALATEVKICGAREINWPRTLRWLRAKWKVQHLLCEGGGELNDALFRARLVDELHLTVCPKIFGGRHAPTIAEGIGFGKLVAAENLTLKSRHQIHDELFLTFTRATAHPKVRLSLPRA